jgi:hypothetical protein
MRCCVALGLLIALCTSAEAAAAHRSRSFHGPAQPRLVVPLDRRLTPSTHFAVPGWTDEQTREWLDYGSRGSHEG